MIKRGLRDLKNKIENMSEEGKEIEKPNEIADTVEKFLEFNDQHPKNYYVIVLSCSFLCLQLTTEINEISLLTHCGLSYTSHVLLEYVKYFDIKRVPGEDIKLRFLQKTGFMSYST